MAGLTSQTCIPCRGGEPPLSDDEIAARMAEVETWTVSAESGIPRLTREFRFKDFALALEFTGRVGRIAEEQGHHPRIVTEWGRVTVEWWTHKIRGLHNNDFIMAARTDQLSGTA